MVTIVWSIQIGRINWQRLMDFSKLESYSGYVWFVISGHFNELNCRLEYQMISLIYFNDLTIQFIVSTYPTIEPDLLDFHAFGQFTIDQDTETSFESRCKFI